MKFKIGDKIKYTIVPASGIWHTGTVHDFILDNQGLIGYVIRDCVTGLRHSISEYGVKPYPVEDTDGDVKITVGDKVPDISKLTIKTNLNQYELKTHVKVPVGDKIPNILEMRYSIGDKVVVETRMDQYEIGSVIDIVARTGVYIVRVRDNRPGLYKERGYMEKEIKGVTRIEDDKWYFVSKKQYGPLDIIGFRIHKIDGTPEIVKGCVSGRLGEDRYKVRFIENNIIQNTFIEVESKDIIGVKTWYKMVPDFLTKKFNLEERIFKPGDKVRFRILGQAAMVDGTIVREDEPAFSNGLRIYIVRNDNSGAWYHVDDHNMILKKLEPATDCCNLRSGIVYQDEMLSCPIDRYKDTMDALIRVASEKYLKNKGEKEMDYSKCYRENQENQKSRKVNVLPVKVIYHNPATIVFWGDGTKTVVKASSHDEFNEYAGFCAALAKKVYGTSSMVRRIVGEGTDELSGKKVKDIQETPKAPTKKPAAKKTSARNTVKKAPAKKPAAKTEKTEETAK